MYKSWKIRIDAHPQTQIILQCDKQWTDVIQQ